MAPGIPSGDVGRIAGLFGVSGANWAIATLRMQRTKRATTPPLSPTSSRKREVRSFFDLAMLQGLLGEFVQPKSRLRDAGLKYECLSTRVDHPGHIVEELDLMRLIIASRVEHTTEAVDTADTMDLDCTSPRSR